MKNNHSFHAYARKEYNEYNMLPFLFSKRTNASATIQILPIFVETLRIMFGLFFAESF